MAGYDCIKFECKHGSGKCKPNSGGSHGRHGLNICFVAQGDKGAVQFVIYTGWIPQYIERSIIGVYNIKNWATHDPIPADLGYHSKVPMYEGQDVITDSCKYCDGMPCYCDGSGINAEGAMYTLVNGGDEALWKFLDAFYDSVFNDGEYPKPTEYAMPRR